MNDLKNRYYLRLMSIHLFGSNGYLSRTKLIPSLKISNFKVSKISRSSDSDIPFKSPSFPPADYAYMALPFEHTLDIMNRLHQDTIPIIEKQVGNDSDSFLHLYSKFEPLFVDHYLFKYIPTLSDFFIDVSKISSINLKISDSSGIDHSIVRDVVQNHGIMVVVEMLSKTLNVSSDTILCNILPFNPALTKVVQNSSITTSTFIQIDDNQIKYNLHVGKMKEDKVSIKIKMKSGDVHNFTIQPNAYYEFIHKNATVLSHNIPQYDAYIHLFQRLHRKDYDCFVTPSQMKRCWSIVRFIL
jgi:hypothetical protein